MKVIIRVIQGLLILAGLNGVYSVAVYFGLGSFYGSKGAGVWSLIGSVVSTVVFVLAVLFLQRYHEKKFSVFSSDQKKVLNLSLAGLVAG